jgi:hypothetical protein
MNFFIPVFATQINESKTLIVHAMPHKFFANKEEVAKHYHKMPWGSISDYRLLKKAGWNISFDFHTN